MSLFAESLHPALGKEPFAERVTWPSAKEALCRESTRQRSAKMPALGKVGFFCSATENSNNYVDFDMQFFLWTMDYIKLNW
jgi:hypothetical protein